VTTNSLIGEAPFEAGRLDRCFGTLSCGLSGRPAILAPALARLRPVIAFAMARMCSGVVPQQPPMMAAPASAYATA
jgi:hypothetical protein